MSQTVEPAYAKVNLYLDVLGMRPDGYHEIVTVMQTISLADHITVAVAPGDGIQISGTPVPGVPYDERNLAYRAAAQFLEAAGLKGSVKIFIDKKIPAAGGLAGGSSDAAATLRALNRLVGFPLSSAALLALSASIGSDLPFCLAGGLALCRGRGELITPVPHKNQLHFLIANGGEPVGTPAAYAAIDCVSPRAESVKDAEKCLSALETGNADKIAQTVYNAFESVILPRCPVADAIKREFMVSGAAASAMSGSGSSVYALFPTETEAKLVQSKLSFPAQYATSVFP